MESYDVGSVFEVEQTYLNESAHRCGRIDHRGCGRIDHRGFGPAPLNL